MPFFRKKPVVIEAIKFDGTPEGAEKIIAKFGATSFALITIGSGKGLHVHTKEGTLKASTGDYIIKGVEGEFYPCKPAIFAKTYEAV